MPGKARSWLAHELSQAFWCSVLRGIWFAVIPRKMTAMEIGAANAQGDQRRSIS